MSQYIQTTRSRSPEQSSGRSSEETAFHDAYSHDLGVRAVYGRDREKVRTQELSEKLLDAINPINRRLAQEFGEAAVYAA